MSQSTPRTSLARRIAAVAALVLLVEAGALAWLAATFPPTPAPVDAALPPGPQIERVERELIFRLPPLTDRFAWFPAMVYADDREAVLAPRDDPPAAAVARFNRTVALFRQEYVGAAALLIAALLFGALGFALTAARGPTLMSLFAPLACCLAVTPIVTELLVGTDFGTSLLPLVLPMLAGGVIVMLLDPAPLRRPVSQLGGALVRSPAALALLSALVFGGVGAGCIALGLDEKIPFVTQIGAVFVANAVVQLGVAAFLGVRRGR